MFSSISILIIHSVIACAPLSELNDNQFREFNQVASLTGCFPASARRH